jgi:DNA-binding NtrC family response regulator
MMHASNETGKPPKILCVDDDFKVLEGLELHLHRRYELSTATSAAATLELLESRSFAVILSDMRMPGMDGAKFLSRAQKLAPDSVRMLLTGQTDLDSAIAAYRLITAERVLLVTEGLLERIRNFPITGNVKVIVKHIRQEG